MCRYGPGGRLLWTTHSTKPWAGVGSSEHPRILPDHCLPNIYGGRGLGVGSCRLIRLLSAEIASVVGLYGDRRGRGTRVGRMCRHVKQDPEPSCFLASRLRAGSPFPALMRTQSPFPAASARTWASRAAWHWPASCKPPRLTIPESSLAAVRTGAGEGLAHPLSKSTWHRLKATLSMTGPSRACQSPLSFSGNRARQLNSQR